MEFEFMKNRPTSRAQLERHLYLLGESINSGKFHLHQGLTRLIDGLMRLRHLPNGRIDLLSLDESTRLTANMMSEMSEQLGGMTGPDPGISASELEAPAPEIENSE